MTSTSAKGSSSAFVIPYYTGELDVEGYGRRYLAEAIEGLFSQTDQDWFAVIVVDRPPSTQDRDFLVGLRKEHHQKIEVILLEQNVGPGVSRNIGVLKARERGSSIILFNDADDISHPKRLEVVKKIFNEDPYAGVVYSTFRVIDENNILTPNERISSPILEILESLENPLEGDNIWIKMGTQTGITNITSSTAVRINFAYQCPFPREKASEDFHTWMRMSAHGATFRFTPLIPTKYRIPSFLKYQSSRTRIGQNNFNQVKVRVDSDGFSKAIEAALIRNVIKPEEIPMLKAKFCIRLAKSMRREKEDRLVDQLLNEVEELEYESSVYLNNTSLLLNEIST